jgi:hypothetical protein
MNSDAACLLAKEVRNDPRLDQESVMKSAVELAKNRDSKSSKQKHQNKGRRTQVETITSKEIETALSHEQAKSAIGSGGEQ